MFKLNYKRFDSNCELSNAQMYHSSETRKQQQTDYGAKVDGKRRVLSSAVKMLSSLKDQHTEEDSSRLLCLPLNAPFPISGFVLGTFSN